MHDGAKFHSSLGVGGLVEWSTLEDVMDHESDEYGRSIELNVAFPAVDWTLQQSVYGWPALQYQAFARGVINVAGHSSCTIALYTDNVLEFAVNDKPFFGGDLYGFRRAPLVLELAPGGNKIDLRLIRDVRLMGGEGSPSICVRLSAQLCTAVLNVVKNSLVLPDVVNGRLTSPYASVTLCNETEGWVDIVATQCREVCPTPPLVFTPNC